MTDKKFGTKEEWAKPFINAVCAFYENPKKQYLTALRYYFLKGGDKKIAFLEEAINKCEHDDEKQRTALTKILEAVNDDLSEVEQRELIELIRKLPGKKN